MVEVSHVTPQVVSEKQKRPKLGESRAIRICNTTPRGLAMFLRGNEGTPFTAVGNAFFSAEYFAGTQRHSRFYRSTMTTDEFSRERVRFTSSNLPDQRKIRYPAIPRESYERTQPLASSQRRFNRWCNGNVERPRDNIHTPRTPLASSTSRRSI